MGKIVLFDLETTGTSVQDDKIVQIAMLKLEDGKEIGMYESLVDPKMVIPAEATEVHGITNEMVLKAPEFEEIAQQVYDFMVGCDVGGYNVVRFDMPLLAQEFDRCDMVVFDWQYKIADAFAIFTKHNPRNLAAAYKFYTGEEMVDAHDAMADTRATQAILRGQVSQHYEGKYSRDEFHAISVGDVNYCTLFRKLYKDDHGVIRYAFGKSKDKAVREDSQYAAWMLKSDFPKAVKNILKSELGW